MVSTTGVVSRWSLPWLALALIMACGGDARAQVASSPGLLATPPEAVEATRTGYRSVLAAGVLDDGGHAVAWLGREATQPQAPWQLWVQRFDRTGRKSGAARQLPYADESIDPRQIAAVVRRDATVVVAWATARPYQSTLPDLMVSTVRTRHFGLDGKPRSNERVLDEVLWQRGQPDAETFEDLVMAQWRDGRYLVGWTVLDAWNRPACTVQRLAADGRPLAPLDRLGPVAGRVLRLTTLEAGGWLATTIARAVDGHLYANITQVDVRPPIGLPLLETLPLRSFVVDLGSEGRLLVAGAFASDGPDPLLPWSLWFNTTGREAERSTPLSVMPVLDLALGDGSWIGLWLLPQSGRMWAQRFDARGAPLGGPMLTSAGRAAKALRMPDGGALLTWVGAGADPSAGTSVLTQRLYPTP